MSAANTAMVTPAPQSRRVLPLERNENAGTPSFSLVNQGLQTHVAVARLDLGGEGPRRKVLAVLWVGKPASLPRLSSAFPAHRKVVDL